MSLIWVGRDAKPSLIQTNETGPLSRSAQRAGSRAPARDARATRRRACPRMLCRSVFESFFSTFEMRFMNKINADAVPQRQWDCPRRPVRRNDENLTNGVVVHSP